MAQHYPFVNPPLPYAYDQLEPFIDTKTMHLHHDKHLQTYVDNLNGILKNYPEYQNLSLEQLLIYYDYFPQNIRTPLSNNAGGVYNHIFYFSNLGNPVAQKPAGSLKDYINQSFGSFSAFKEQFVSAAKSVFGSGYTWLVLDKNGMLRITSTANQDTPLPHGFCPLLNIDVWEHAYYLKHYNVRADYISDWFSIVNWEKVTENLVHCIQS